jgi:hypothetical protein
MLHPLDLAPHSSSFPRAGGQHKGLLQYQSITSKKHIESRYWGYFSSISDEKYEKIYAHEIGIVTLPRST